MESNQKTETTVRSVLETIDPAILLPALHASMGDATPENLEALDTVAQKLKKSGVECGPDGCLRGFVKRQMMTFAGENTIRQLHQAIAQSR